MKQKPGNAEEKTLRRFVLRHLIADAPPLSSGERWRSAVAALAGMLLLQGILHLVPLGNDYVHLLAPLGATSVILFALPHSPLGQPWPMVGGLLLSALIGWLCGTFIHPETIAAAVAVALSIWVMARLRCIHPPGGAMAIVCALGAAHVELLLMALVNTLGILVAAIIINNLLPKRRYPGGLAHPAQAVLPPPKRAAIAHVDLRYALEAIDAYLDISEEDLVEVYELATAHALQRHERRLCSEIMTPDPLCVAYGDSLNDAWLLLRRHHLKALPVVDRSRRLVGLLTLDDFLHHVEPDLGRSIADNVRKLLRSSGRSHSNRPEAVGQIMRTEVVVAHTTDSIAKIAALLSAKEHPSMIPVLDEENRVAGALSQTDVLAALYHQRAVGLPGDISPELFQEAQTGV